MQVFCIGYSCTYKEVKWMSKSEDSSTVDEQNIHHRGSDGQFSSERDSACD